MRVAEFKVRVGRSVGPFNQYVFPFSANLASMMTLEMIRMVIGESWWPDRGGKLHYSMIPNRLTTDHGSRGPHCEVSARTALGDQFTYPFIDDTPTDGARSVTRRISVRSALGRLARAIGRRRR